MRNSAAEDRLLTQASAPASRVNSATVSESCMDKNRIFVSGMIERMRRAAAVPLMTGMLRSRITKSGFSSAALLTASSPSDASPHTSQRDVNSVAMPFLTTS